MSWKTNPIMEWSFDGGTSWVRVPDHGRSPLDTSVERIGESKRVASGMLRRYTVAKKRTWSLSWENLPDKAVDFLANGTGGADWLEYRFNQTDGDFLMRIRKGSDVGASTVAENYRVVFTEFGKTVTKRGVQFDLLSVDMTLEEV